MHVLADGTLPPMNVHSGNPVADGQVVPFNLLDLHAPCWRNPHLLDLHVWTFSSEFPAALSKSAGKSGDVLLATMSDHPIAHRLTRQCYTISATTDHVRCSTPLPRAATTLASEPLALL